jgi:hypothetical protein
MISEECMMDGPMAARGSDTGREVEKLVVAVGLVAVGLPMLVRAIAGN